MNGTRNESNGVNATLNRIDRAQRWLFVTIAAATLVEGVGILAFALTVDLGDATHRVLIAHALLVYGTLSIGLIALGVFSSRNTLRVIRAIELLGEERAP